MKKLILSLIFFLPLVIFTNEVFAVSPTPSKTITPTIKAVSPSPAATTPESAEIDRIQKIKELVASRVAELNLVEKRGILGTVKETSTMQIIVEDRNGDQRTIDIDELTKFQKNGDDKTFGISDVKKDDKLSFIGLYNKETKRLLARFISKNSSIPQYLEGVVTDKDTKNYTLTVIDEKGNKKVVDVSSSTKTSSFDKEVPALKSGFTKIQVGERILAAGFWDLKDKETLNASRIIHFKSLTPSSKMKAYLTTSNEEKTSTGSGVKLQNLSQ